jgi:hypothetical protein
VDGQAANSAHGERISKGETSPQEAARKHGLMVAEVEEGRERFLAAAENVVLPRDQATRETSFRYCGKGRRRLTAQSWNTSTSAAKLPCNRELLRPSPNESCDEGP